MPPRESTRSSAQSEKRENVQYIVRGSSPVFATMCVLTFMILVAGLVVGWMELTEDFNYEPLIFFAPDQ